MQKQTDAKFVLIAKTWLVYLVIRAINSNLYQSYNLPQLGCNPKNLVLRTVLYD